MSEGVQQGTVLPGGAVVDALLAEGRLCSVYRATMPDGATVAARVLRADLTRDLADWFLDTARLRASIEHPNLPRVYASGLHEGRAVEITQLLAGRTAQDLIDQGQNGLDVPTAVRMLRAIAAALDHLHARTPPVLHRALMPEHVLVRDDDGAVMLLGVGEAERPRISVTRPAYLSPEELADVSSLSPRADVFSLATLTYELFTGRPAFVGGGDVVLDIVRMTRFPRLREHRTDLHARAEHVLREAWSLTPDDRPPSAGRFASLFADAVNQQSHTLVNIPTAPAMEAKAKLTLNGPGPLDVSTRRALRDERAEGPAPPVEGLAESARPISPAGGRALRANRGASQRPRVFLPRPGDAAEEATRPEISVPSEVSQSAEPPPGDATPVEGTSSPEAEPPKPRFNQTTPGFMSPLPSAPASVSPQDDPGDSELEPTPAFVSAHPAPHAEPKTEPEHAVSDPPRAQTAVTQAFASMPAATGEPDASPPPPPSPPPGPLTGTHFDPQPPQRQPLAAQPHVQQPQPPQQALPSHQPPQPQPQAQQPQPQAQQPQPQAQQPQPYVPQPPPPASPPEASPYGDFYAAAPGEQTQILDIPAPKPQPAGRSPLVVAAALIANAIAIAGIAHAIAWVQISRAAPTIVQAPAPTCAPCASCPPPPVCPPTEASPPPTAPARAPTRVAAPRPLGPRPAPAIRPNPGF
ncbi:MAG: protein kinase [Polyangiales bacterium]